MGTELGTQIGETVSLLVVFLLFFWIMKKIAWKPVLKILDDRQAKIHAGFEEVRKLQQDAKAEHARYEAKLRDIEAEARDRIQEAVNDGKRIAAEIGDKARADAQQITEKARQNIHLEIETTRKQMREEIVELTLLAAEKILGEKMSEAKDREMVGAFVSGLERKS